MIRRCTALFFTAAFLVVGLALADDPAPGKPADKNGDTEGQPLRLKKKKRPDEPAKVEPGKVEPPKAEPGKVEPPKVDDKEEPKEGTKLKTKNKGKEKAGEDEPLVPEDGRPGGAEEDEKELLDRIGRNMRSVEEKLANKELGDPTRQSQEDILKDLDALISRSQGGQPPPDGGGGGQDNQPQGGEDGAQGKQAKGGGGGGGKQKASGQSAGRNRSGQGKGQRQRASRQRPGGGSPMAKAGTGSGQQQPGPTGTGGNTGGAGKDSPVGPKDRSPEYKDVWGHLPESLRAEMNAYSNPQPFMPRYDDLIKKYYRTIAEQGRRKGD